MARRRPSFKPLPPSARDLVDRLYDARVPLGVALLALLVLVFGWWAYRTWHTRQESAAQFLLTRALVARDRSPGTEEDEEGKEEPGKHLEKALELFRQIRDEYPASRAAEQAVLQIGNIHYERGEYQEALEAYQAYLGEYPKGESGLLAGLGKGYALEAQKRDDAAAATFRAMADRYEASILTVEALMGLGRSLIQLDQRTEAKALYRRIIEEYPGTRWAKHARNQVASLER